MRGRWPVLLVVAGLAALLGWYGVFTQRVIGELRRETAVSGRMYARIYGALADTASGESIGALLELSRAVVELGVPVIVTAPDGTPTAAANLPFAVDSLTDPRVRAYVETLDRENVPILEPEFGTVHIGSPPLVDQLRTIPVLQGILLAFLTILGGYLLWTRERAEREHVWMGMAREAAHQLGTPLTSLSGWIEVLRDRAVTPADTSAVEHMEGDLERLERVAHRFERIGRPPKRQAVDIGALTQRVVAYFRARVPSLAHPIVITCRVPPSPLEIQGDPVLLEWVLESLVKNAIDALAGRGGRIDVQVEQEPEGGVRIRVADDGPGVPKELRTRIFEPGFSTKRHGWGIGLSLARRIVQESHRGRLLLAQGTGNGATFDVILK